MPGLTATQSAEGKLTGRRISSELSPKVDKVMPPTSYSLSLFFVFLGLDTLEQ
jgi:hypothetical protein